MSNTALGFRVTVIYHLDNMIMSDDLEQDHDNNLEEALSFIVGNESVSHYARDRGDIRSITTYVDEEA